MAKTEITCGSVSSPEINCNDMPGESLFSEAEVNWWPMFIRKI